MEFVLLLRRDGTMLMRYPNPEMAVGVRLPLFHPGICAWPKAAEVTSLRAPSVRFRALS